MKINHIIDDLLGETNVNIITTNENFSDYTYIKDLILYKKSNIMGKNIDENKDIKVDDKDVIYFETYGRDVCFTTIDNELLVIKTSMKKLEDILISRNYFVKVSKSIIININHIQEINYHSNMRFQVLLTNGYKQLVNRSYFKDFKKSIEEVYN
ncbi:MAG: LytTR family DNA-binding domain-containing protein [Paraclostridium sp.]|uniref:LytTR family DNA-binding domain-containing protein n=1 Tax=Paraclostridium sp. TaxID=2023273 RepID=UPI003A9F7041